MGNFLRAQIYTNFFSYFNIEKHALKFFTCISDAPCIILTCLSLEIFFKYTVIANMIQKSYFVHFLWIFI